MITIADAAQFIGIDYYEDDPLVTANLQRAVDSSVYRLKSSVGEKILDHFATDPRVDSLMLIYAEEQYDNHTGSNKQASAQNHVRNLYEDQLRLELRRAVAAKESGDTA